MFSTARKHNAVTSPIPRPALIQSQGIDSLTRQRKGEHIMLNRLTDALNFQTQALALRSERQRLLASNIANADTPGYQARDMDFARALRDATSARDAGGSSPNSASPGTAGASAGPNNLARTQSGHLALSIGSRRESELLFSTAAQTNMDSNTVDMDRERASFADNSVKYEATLRFINGSVRTAMDAMKSHNAA
jgi:flagellar basal-body rod protein FlgB